MSIAKIIFGFLLLGLIPAHWFIAGLTFTALTGSFGIFLIALWIALFVGGLSLIISGFSDQNHNEVQTR